MNRRNLLIFAANLPWTIWGLILACLSGPKQVLLVRNPPAIVFVVASFWWYTWLPNKQRVRAMTHGHTILLGPLELDHDIDHELVHVEQAMREPFLYPFRYFADSRRHPGKFNRYEQEAYSRSGSAYTAERSDI